MQYFSTTHSVIHQELDFLGHVNNKNYLDWMEQVAWAHAQSVGISHELQTQLNRILAVYEHKMQYLASCYEGDNIELRTWVGKKIGCCQRERFFEFIRLGKTEAENKIVFKAQSIYVCISLNTHRPKRIPDEFIHPYFSKEKTPNK